ncbi:MAG TPA: TetR/AcrR family transcriptional regulator [Gammaproteobacteria bacterium]|nr:TetR/AcrR family transcriptional regulator [Gammaproteobacteria bacterium]
MQKTRRQLHEALLSRILEKKYESITVQEILDRAEIGRSTFYAHFRDKDELLASGFLSFKESLEAAETATAASTAAAPDRIIEGSFAVFEHAARYREVHRALTGSRAEVVVRRNLHGVFFDVIGRRVEREMRKQKGRDRGVSPELLTLFLVATQSAVLNWWLAALSPLPVADVDAAYRRLVSPVLESVFESAARGDNGRKPLG